MRVDQLQSHNASLGDGRGAPFAVIPFKTTSPALAVLNNPLVAPSAYPVQLLEYANGYGYRRNEVF
ncbi:hypothetical protein B0H17DRAFT_1030438 [Mycena rosella]|uniref:Uncharacterized protein n=1 Tax=Mycena rosella TaxID=1033263 RepID=A0AAD7GZ68_MYCRO|nr:hypothetical protein B0H17DRAFT_1030438 [Mycena rosella]